MARRGTVLSPPRDGEPVPPPSVRQNHRSLRVTTIAATAMTFLLIAVGALVRATGSGEGCTGWPKCSATSWLPPLEYHAVIEYSHRMTAFLDIVLVALLALVATRRYRAVPRVFRTAWLAVGLIFVQAGLGGVVVKGDLAALLVTAHLGTAMVLAGALVYATVAAFSIGHRRLGAADTFTRLARAAAGGTFALMLVGAYVRGENAGLAFPDWPLMGGRVVPPLPTVQASLHFTHRVLAVAVGALVVALVAVAWRDRARRGPAAVLALVAFGLFVAQVLVGAANVWTHLSQPAVVAHVAVAGLVWGSLVATAAAARVAAPVSQTSGAGRESA